ncbi:MAG TPA: pyrophosphate--fructose-6-phosphate 1-phosphotransferase [Candidatus Marinimicrobia bacterium]|jgi:pyrophosphate--fructose-6-phosphate 1-phosphotransferase|nr:pyrophosphate--fructose-6-phosphate 1-phosphotransferase [Candidatus Neomarinimicrobiota bacterium]MDP6296632.1 pyrophosphate--fructose-6-phosphate 1-phosphotransferase [Candidatus Neomarinimicrobiota bacterium]MDP7122346.1 pyrophosphate--fructose-6-phosphate 1-phosphotransferase [Candidatus Neomarinimicrobiota bacterium]MDP7483756.1 pyrophosphate--fructose-6-phosphate 1-phosphotransferase [Candidatus Neomarinimicrobiota bacterium]MDP7528158.1 pyrophosphate--fructose-6-phosphate 1-phosphotra|tara:strand:+ start:3488 stop:4696 length:1209 start_codon:yes stop_codon:yes gene_type:complete
MSQETTPKIAFLTAGGIAPCLSASIGALMLEYNHKAPESDMLGYLHGYRGLLLGQSLEISTSVRERAQTLLFFGGSPIGNSRVKLTNVEDCLKRGFIKEGEEPLKIAARQLLEDGISILHTIGGDDTNSMAASLVDVLKEMGAELTVVGLPKTVDNDVYPIVQTLGAATAAEQGAVFFENIANENTTSRRQLIIHEVMGRHCGWLTAATAHAYRERLKQKIFLPEILISEDRWDLDAVYVPETELDFSAECDRLMKRMDEKDGVNIFLSEGAGIETIVKEKEAAGEAVARDAFGHLKLDLINPGLWFAEQFGERLQADKILVQKSGYFARSAAPNEEDLDLVKRSAAMAAECALKGESGVVGLDMDEGGQLSLIDFDRIIGGKSFDVTTDWFNVMLGNIGQA